MFGQNPVRKKDLHPEGKLWVQEIFATIQGEGRYAGVPSIFIRVAGCNLQCTFCDTDFESAFASTANFQDVQQIISTVQRLRVQFPGCHNAVITGGEPLRQNIVPLIRALLDDLDMSVEIETAGTLWFDEMESIADDVHITVSPKTPDIHPRVRQTATVFKYVVSEDNVGPDLCPMHASGKPLAQPSQDRALGRSLQTVYVQPMDDPDKEKAARNLQVAIEMCKQIGCPLSLQTHKMIGVP